MPGREEGRNGECASASVFSLSPWHPLTSFFSPWQMHSLTDVHTDLGKLPYVSGEGYAPAARMRAWTALSMASVVTPGATSMPA